MSNIIESKDVLSKRYELLSSIGEEIVTEKELLSLVGNTNNTPTCYDGFEPSGNIHIAQGLLKTLHVKKMVKSGCNVILWIADWFAQLNNKMGGDLKKIQTVGKYMIEVWKASGMPTEKVQFLWASEEIQKRSDLYWTLVMDICRTFNINQLRRCTKILGRTERRKTIATSIAKARKRREQFEQMRETGDVNWDAIDDAFDEYEEALEAAQDDSMPTAYLLYAAMQCADVYFLGAHICQLGMDQRKVNVLAREYHDHLFRAKKTPIVPYRPKPIIISHHMLMGLGEGQEKMSKSDPESAIFMTDTEQEVNRKIKRSFCRPTEVDGNPILDYVKHLIFPIKEFDGDSRFEIHRSEKHGGPLMYDNYNSLETDFVSGKLHPADLKPAVSKEINRLLQPIRLHFKTNKDAKKLWNQVKKYKVTR